MRKLMFDRCSNMALIAKIVLIAVGLAIGLAIGWRTNGAVVAQSTPTYRVIGAMKDSTMEKELNEAARQGCEPLLGIGGAPNTEPMLVMKCRGG
jgi:hypothetical protein